MMISIYMAQIVLGPNLLHFRVLCVKTGAGKVMHPNVLSTCLLYLWPAAHFR